MGRAIIAHLLPKDTESMSETSTYQLILQSRRSTYEPNL